MKILIPTADFPPIEGGISTVCLQLARSLAKLGHDVYVVAPRLDDMSAFDSREPYPILRYGGYNLGPVRVLPMFVNSWDLAKSCDLIISMWPRVASWDG